jgi:hypothetical protein
LSYTTPPTFASGAVLTAAQAQILSDDIAYLYQNLVTFPMWHGARAYRNVAVSIPDSTSTLVTFPDGENFDTDAFHDLVTNPGRFTLSSALVPAGKTAAVLVSAYLTFATNTTGYREVRLLQNGTTNVQQTMPATATVTPGLNATFFTTGVANDYFELQVYQNSGGSLSLANAAMGIQVIGIQ